MKDRNIFHNLEEVAWKAWEAVSVLMIWKANCCDSSDHDFIN